MADQQYPSFWDSNDTYASLGSAQAPPALAITHVLIGSITLQPSKTEISSQMIIVPSNFPVHKIPDSYLSTVVTTDPKDVKLFRYFGMSLLGLGDVFGPAIVYTLNGDSPVSVDFNLIYTFQTAAAVVAQYSPTGY